MINNENIFSIEKKLTSKERKELPDSAYGIPSKRKYPLYKEDGTPDTNHIRSAITMFGKADNADKKQLASKIRTAAKKAGIEIKKDSDINKF